MGTVERLPKGKLAYLFGALQQFPHIHWLVPIKGARNLHTPFTPQIINMKSAEEYDAKRMCGPMERAEQGQVIRKSFQAQRTHDEMHEIRG